MPLGPWRSPADMRTPSTTTGCPRSAHEDRRRPPSGGPGRRWRQALLQRISIFALGCQELKDLTITTALGKTDFSALGQALALQSVFLGVRSAVIERLASDSPHLLITNGEVCFRGGQKISYFDDYDRERDAIFGIRSPFR
jgi:hypothetical protein